MIGILVQLALSWALLWWLERKHLGVLGFRPTIPRLLDFMLFFTVTGLICASGFGLKIWIAHLRFEINPNFTSGLLLDGARWNMNSVLFEELIFRGALFYILIQRLGSRKATWISAVSFGVYHWFSHGTFGNPQAMFWDFVITGTMGLVLGYGFVKTGSLYVPVAIHFGWNFVQQSVFSSGPIGKQVFVEVLPRAEVPLSQWAWLAISLFPVVSVLLVNYWILATKKEDAFGRKVG